MSPPPAIVMGTTLLQHSTQSTTAKRKANAIGASNSSGSLKTGNQRITLTSKHNWWLIDVEEEDENEEEPPRPPPPPPKLTIGHDRPPVDVSPPQFHAPIHPSSIFVHHPPPSPSPFSQHPQPSFPFPAPQNPTARLLPIASGSTSELFKCIIKKPDIVQMEINGEVQTNAPDVLAQFLAELRVYSTLKGQHRNFPAYLGSLEGVGMVLEYIEGKSLHQRLCEGPLERSLKINMHDQLLDGLTYLHSFGLSHGDLSLLNVLVTPSGTLKILDFGRSTSITSTFIPASDPPPEPDMSIFGMSSPSGSYGGYSQTYPNYHHYHQYQHHNHHRPPLGHRLSTQSIAIAPDSHITLQLGRDRRTPYAERSSPTPTITTSNNTYASSGSSTLYQPSEPTKKEQIHLGTRPFSAPEILLSQCLDPLLSDAYSFGMILLCLDVGGLVSFEERKQVAWETPPGIADCQVFQERVLWYVCEVAKRRRLMKEDFMARNS
ncbi:hypothetical protein Clacol_000743 [Clathrus columnatus]|uniref:Protein kinase domain-containing protein n=1 Tax=Clathrus columnatus TaxID=1419009 RepID=A0AAV5A0K1_9AGAM|nr:hypothetical protein Clacol_000743 [Clathrus columnatus]